MCMSKLKTYNKHIHTDSAFIPLQVLRLLDKMKLGNYKEGFEREQIDGALLLSCDNKILEFDLGMTSRLHQLKILRLIQGDIPAAVLGDLI